MEQILKDVFAVEVPIGADNFKLIPDADLPTVGYDFDYATLNDRYFEEHVLPPGSYEILFTTKDCSEENAKKVAESISPYISGRVFRDYRTGYFEFDTACASLESLLRSKNLDPAKNYLLIRKL